jgi:hypothetical protein
MLQHDDVDYMINVLWIFPTCDAAILDLNEALWGLLMNSRRRVLACLSNFIRVVFLPTKEDSREMNRSSASSCVLQLLMSKS